MADITKGPLLLRAIVAYFEPRPRTARARPGWRKGCQLLREWIDQLLRRCAFRRVPIILTDANTGLGKIGNKQ
eukprot:4740532-Pyramimonas_sp.AAC.1